MQDLIDVKMKSTLTSSRTTGTLVIAQSICKPSRVKNVTRNQVKFIQQPRRNNN